MKAKTAELVQAPSEAINEDEGPVVVKLILHPDTYREYKELAEKQDLTAAELMAHRLTRCKDHSSIRSLYFSSSQVARLEQLLQKRPLETAEQAISLVAAAFSFRVGDFPPVPISPSQSKRIHMGAFSGQTPYDRLCYIVQGAVAKMTGA